MKHSGLIRVVLLCILLPLMAGCGVYSLTGANITGKTINIHTLQNRAPNVAPSLGTTLTNQMRDKILSQTGLTAVNSDNADYDMVGTITNYSTSYTGVQTSTTGAPQSSTNRLTITVEIDFKNKKDEKASFKQSFSRFDDYPAGQSLTVAEPTLITNISSLLAQDIFNKAFVNW